MPRIPRKLLLDPAEVGVFHCLSRCVRRAFLCGADPLSGKNFYHRTRWLQERIAVLAGEFGSDVLGFTETSRFTSVFERIGALRERDVAVETAGVARASIILAAGRSTGDGAAFAEMPV